MPSEVLDPIVANSTGVSNPLVLVQSMIEHGADPDALKKMMDLAERFQANQARSAYHSAMNEAQKEMGVIVKNRENSQTQSRYANLEAVNLIAKPVYTKHGFCLSFGEEDAKRENCWKIYCDVKHIGGHQERYAGEFPLDNVGPKGNPNKTPIQAVVSSGSYAARILITRIFNLTIAETDVDGQTGEELVDAAQVEELSKLMVAANQDEGPFYQWAGIKKLEEMPKKLFPVALDLLRKKVKRK